jgi:hypothetical protein
MSQPDRADKRRRHRELSKRGTQLLKSGLPKHPERRDIEAAAFALQSALDHPPTAAAAAQAAFDAAARHAAPTNRLACKKGCGYCCYGIVMISAPEAFRLAAWISAQGADRVATFRQAAALSAGKTSTQRLGAKLPCPLLQNGACSAYAVRPISCRTITSFDLAPCIDEYEGHDGLIAVPDHYTTHGANVQLALAAALTASGRPVAYYEFSAAILRVLDTRDALQRWSRGDDIFAGVLQDRDGVVEIANAAHQIAATLSL